jgi:hypothetical protein
MHQLLSLVFSVLAGLAWVIVGVQLSLLARLVVWNSAEQLDWVESTVARARNRRHYIINITE